MKLDEDIIRKNGITHDEWMDDLHTNHIIALRVEVAEFVNEAREWKYWKKKPIDRERVIDEAVDVIHFLMLILNKNRSGLSDDEVADAVETAMPDESANIKDILHSMLVEHAYNEILAYLLYVLNDYNFTTQDILEAYNRKNKVNFERLESGY